MYMRLIWMGVNKVQKIKNDIKDVSGILKDNKKLVDYIEKLDIYVKISNLSKDNILNYNENQIFYETRRKQKLMNELYNISSENNMYLNSIYNTIKNMPKN